jgi:hypothetical protein
VRKKVAGGVEGSRHVRTTEVPLCLPLKFTAPKTLAFNFHQPFDSVQPSVSPTKGDIL